MQGRLVPRYQNRYQSFPLPFWQAEFPISKALGFSSIEFILDYDDADKNPLMSDHGRKEIQHLIDITGVKVVSICADYFMKAPFHVHEHQKRSESVLLQLMKETYSLGVRDIVIPCVDESKLNGTKDWQSLADSLKRVLSICPEPRPRLNLETDLNADDFKKLLSLFESGTIFVNYDTGNSASLGYNPDEEFAAYGSVISDFHIKDRKFGTSSVFLGIGDVDFQKIKTQLQKHHFKGTIILQASRQDDYLADLNNVKKQLEFTQKLLQDLKL
jgi:sugar phosphate isomerase/epimerase